MRPKLLSICLILAFLTIAVYWPISGHPFIAYDDQLYVTENQNVKAGLSWHGVYWAFTSFEVANWHPVTWLSHQLDITLFGLAPGAHHLSNLLFHTANTLLLFLLLASLTHCRWRSAFVAALFALHPLHVESVAWIAERKDLLCAFFFFLMLHAYCRFTSKGRWQDFATALLLYALSLMAKPMSVTAPFMLLLLDWWPLRRIDTIPFRRIILEKTPFILLSVISAVITVLAQQSGGAIIAVEKLGLIERMTNALSAYTLYLWKMIWPFDLAFLYPLPATPPFQTAFMGLILIVLLTTTGFYLRANRPYLLVGWLWYLVMLTPVIGLVQVGVQSHADRYTYLPMIGCSLAVAWGAHDLSAQWRHGLLLCKMIAAGLLLLLAIQTRHQISVWQSSETLFRHTLAVTGNNYVIHTSLGIVLWDSGNHNEAIGEYRKAVAICPNYATLHYFLANALLIEGNTDEAIIEYTNTLQLQPEYPYAHTNRGMALQMAGRNEEAIMEYREGVRLAPNDYKAGENLQILLKQRHPDVTHLPQHQIK